VQVTPKFVIEAMNAWQAAILRVIGWMLGIRGEARIAYIEFDNDEVEPTINDIKRNNEENEMNRQVDKETGE
jgi:hypothetical protein